MKIKLALIVLVAVLSTGCVKEIIKTEYVEKKVPVNAVPQPPKVERPLWETSKLTTEQRKDIGVVSKAVVTELKQKDGYIEILELIINKYKEAADKSEVLVAPLFVPGVSDKDASKP